MKLEKEVYIDKINKLCNMNVCFYEPFTLKEVEILKKIAIKRKLKLTLEVEEPILDEAERKYLSSVIRPFRNRINYIIKLGGIPNEFILIDLIDDLPIQLPYFEKDKMYNGMKLNKKYKLEDLKI